MNPSASAAAIAVFLIIVQPATPSIADAQLAHRRVSRASFGEARREIRRQRRMCNHCTKFVSLVLSDGGPPVYNQSASEADVSVQVSNTQLATRLYERRIATVASIIRSEIVGRVTLEVLAGRGANRKQNTNGD